MWSGNWIGVVCACVHLELQRDIGFDLERAPDDALRSWIADARAFCDLPTARDARSLRAFLAFLRNRPVAAPGTGNWGRVPDQAALWYLETDPAEIPDLERELAGDGD